jgi:hypothetical protein
MIKEGLNISAFLKAGTGTLQKSAQFKSDRILLI